MNMAQLKDKCAAFRQNRNDITIKTSLLSAIGFGAIGIVAGAVGLGMVSNVLLAATIPSAIVYAAYMWPKKLKEIAAIKTNIAKLKAETVELKKAAQPAAFPV
jgi:hypothetical protein